MSGAASDGRAVALGVLRRVLAEDAWASAALDAALSREVGLGPRDRRLATTLVYGTLRALPWLERELDTRATRGIRGLAVDVRAPLLLAAYQLAFLDRVPDFAAVDHAVAAVKRAKGREVAGFANALLRRLARELGDVDRARAVHDSAPRWLREKLARSLGGKEAARAFLVPEGGAEVPAACLRVEAGAGARAGLREAIAAELAEAAPGAEVTDGRVSGRALLVRGAGDVRTLGAYRRGEVSVQEEGSQLVALAVGAREGERVLDACAGRGNKTTLLARAVGPSGSVDACDLHPSKLERLAEETARLGLAPPRTFAVDWSVGAGRVEGGYDRVLVDAPCSGTGTLRRRPEIALRRTLEDVARLADLQRTIFARTAALVRPGGTLVYATCSVLADEAEAVVSGAADARLRAAPFEADELRALAGEASTLRLLPQAHGTDGYFVARFVRDA